MRHDIVGLELRILLVLADVVLIVKDIDLPLILLAQYLNLTDDLLSGHGGLDALVIVQDDPEAGGRVCLQLHGGRGIREGLCREEGQKAWKEVLIRQEDQLRRPSEGTVAKEEQAKGGQGSQSSGVLLGARLLV